MKPATLRLLLISCALLTASPPAPGAPLPASDSEANPHIRPLLENGAQEIAGTTILADQTIAEMYRERQYRPLWTDPDDVGELLELIRGAPAHGLKPEDYNLQELTELLARWRQSPSPEIEAKAEILLTESLLRYGYHRRLGKIRASDLDPDINFRREAFRNQPPHVTMQEIMEGPSLQAFIDLAAPTGPYYRALQGWLEAYREIEAAGGWNAVPAGPTLRRGDNDSRVRALRARLAASGNAPAPAGAADEYDRALEGAVKTFQARHGLVADGIAGAQTYAAMNVPVGHRIDQLRASLERLRWVNQETAENLVAVNIAGYRAMFINGDDIVWTTRAMVGKNYRQTPVFRGDIAYMEFNPTWTIPPGILRNDTLPAIKKDPGYLARKNIRVIDRQGRFVDPDTVDWHKYTTGVPYTLRQDPGPNNALGTVKFIFPNQHFVFLHDTPQRELFDRPERAFSSGCIRVEDPLRLGELLLNEAPGYRRSDLQAIIDSRETKRINLPVRVPVIIVYLTADLDHDGHVRFLKDVYGRDQAVLTALDGPVTIQLPAVNAR